jgi:5-methyltetrahydropteroyltriglutamate--homocysteine methyltransferase
MPSIRAEHVGSLLRPAKLLEAQDQREAGALSNDELAKLEDEAALEAIRLQSVAGMRLFTDGEMRREDFMASVFESVGGLVKVDPSLGRPPRWHRDSDDAEVQSDSQVGEYAIGEPLYRKTSQSVTEARFLKQHSPGPFKITMASPTMIANLWRMGVSDAIYPTRNEAVAAMAQVFCEDIEVLIDAGANWLQLDSLAYWPNLDPEAAKMRGITDLDANLTRIINTDNTLVRSARAKSADVTVGMHICRGNMRSAWAVSGGYEPIAERVFGEVEVDRYLLEFDDKRSGGFEPLRFVPKGKTVVLGLVSSKVPQLENIDDLRRRIDEAAKYVPLDQLAISPQCGFASTKHGNLLSVDDERRKLELVVQTAELVWGSTAA